MGDKIFKPVPEMTSPETNPMKTLTGQDRADYIQNFHDSLLFPHDPEQRAAGMAAATAQIDPKLQSDLTSSDVMAPVMAQNAKQWAADKSPEQIQTAIRMYQKALAQTQNDNGY
jgi:hypothetical protein